MIERKSQLERRLRIVLAPRSPASRMIVAVSIAAVSLAAMAANVEVPALRQKVALPEHAASPIEASPSAATTIHAPAAAVNAAPAATIAPVEIRDLAKGDAVPTALPAPKVAQTPVRLANAVEPVPTAPAPKEAPTSQPAAPTKPISSAPLVGLPPPAKIPNLVKDPAIKLKRTHFVAPITPWNVPGVSGRVAVDVVFTIGIDGRVEEAHEVNFKSDAVTDAAVTAVRQWLFEPPLRDGNPTTARNIVRVVMEIPATVQ